MSAPEDSPHESRLLMNLTIAGMLLLCMTLIAGIPFYVPVISEFITSLIMSIPISWPVSYWFALVIGVAISLIAIGIGGEFVLEVEEQES